MRMNCLRLFTSHPSSINESYREHFAHAAAFSMRMIAGGIACLIHSILPFVYVDTASSCIKRLHATMVARQRSAESAVVPPGN